MRTTTTSSLMPALMVIFGLASTSKAVDFHVATAQGLQSALTVAANNGGANNIYLTNGDYEGNFAYNSTGANNLTLLAEPGVTNSAIIIDGGGTGAGLNISSSATSNTITVQGISFPIDCGVIDAATPVGTLIIAAGSEATISVNGCAFFGIANGAGNGLAIVSGLNATLNGCTFAGAQAGSSGEGAGYGGIGAWTPNFTGNLDVQNCVFSTNQAIGLSAVGAAIVISNNVFTGNVRYGLSGSASVMLTASRNTFNSNGLSLGGASGGGAGVGGTPMVNFTGNTFSTNGGTADNPNGYGGGLLLGGDGVVNITGNLFQGNVATADLGFGENGGGGGVSVGDNTYYGFTSTFTVTSNVFVGNSGGDLGGAILVDLAEATVTIQANTFEQNTANGDGGALYVSAPTITISDNLMTGNKQTNSSLTGGGVWVEASSNLFFINNTITSNTSAGGGGGAAFQITGTAEVLNVFNNIIWGNSGTSGADVWIAGTPKTSVFSNNDANGIFGIWDVFQNNINMNPLFVAPTNGNYQLQRGSPCIGAGTISAPALPTTDLDGNPTVLGGSVAIGCYDFNAINSNITLGQPQVSGGLFQIPFTVGSASVLSFQLLQAAQITGPWTTNSSAFLSTTLAGVSYSFIVPVGGSQTFYRVLAP